MSICEADYSDGRVAKVSALLHSALDIPGSLLGTPPKEESAHSIHFGSPHTLAESSTKEDYYKFYEPRVVSIGPVHHKKTHVEPMENFKRKAVRELAERVKDNVSIEQVYVSVEQLLLRARECYTWNEYSDDTWCLMMLLDGCFIIEFIYQENIVTSGRRSSSWLNIMKKRERDLVWRDLLLFENQLPFQVLDVLAHAFRCNKLTFELLTTRFLKLPLLNISSAPTPTSFDYINGVSHRQRQQGKAPAPAHLLQYYRDLWISVLFGGEEEEDNNKEEDRRDACPSFSVTELKKVGIRCSCASDPSTDIRFKSSMLSGKLFIPQLTIDEWTLTLAYNLVAYEYPCSSQYRSFGNSSYLSFMSMLINGEGDVKELQYRGILQVNFKIGDDQVVNFFKDITAHNDSNPQAYRHVKRQISTYFKRKRRPLMVTCAELKQRYFSGPWSILVFLAVIFTVSMTVIQTVLTGIQTYK